MNPDATNSAQSTSTPTPRPGGPGQLTHAELLQLKRWNTPTIYNGWEQITRHDSTREGFNLEETRDYMPQMGPMVGYAMTLVVQPGDPEHRRRNPRAWATHSRRQAWVFSHPP